MYKGMKSWMKDETHINKKIKKGKYTEIESKKTTKREKIPIDD